MTRGAADTYVIVAGNGTGNEAAWTGTTPAVAAHTRRHGHDIVAAPHTSSCTNMQ
jgi:hypothetical protein